MINTQIHHFIIILLYFIAIYVLKVMYVYCICTIEILLRWCLAEHLVPTPHSMSLKPEISRGGSIYTMEAGKCCKQALFLLMPQRDC